MYQIKNAFLIGLSIMLLLVVGCKSDVTDLNSEKLMKSWQLVSMTKNEQPVSLTDCQQGELILFAEKNVCYIYTACDNTDLRSAWNYEIKTMILNISDYLPMTFYIQQLDAGNLTVRYYDYSSDGKLDTYKKYYKSVQTTLENGKLRLKQ